VLVITYFSLIIGELVPKRIALAHPERLASALAGPMLMLSRIASPMVRFLTVSTELVLRLIPVRKSDAPPITEEEIAVLLQQGTDAGIFEEREQEIVGNVFRLGDRRIASLITPRVKIVWLDLEDPPDEHIKTMREERFSRYPVCEGSLDKVAGIVEVKELWAAHLAGAPLDLRKCLRRPLLVPESVDVLRVLELFHETSVHLAIVLDEHGGVEGLVTLSDVLEALGGEATSGRATDTPAIVQREDGSWLVDGSLPMDEFRDTFELPPAAPEERHAYHTVGGFVTANLGRIPGPGDAFEAHGIHVEVMDMDGYRVDKILVRREEPAQTESSGPG
jgi:putative hemolysin